ncbi:MAG: HDOD domain-containing protein [Planctomycetes bacterium]|nr:HDOD domain-containing protein [Planctomycetota bacterium]
MSQVNVEKIIKQIKELPPLPLVVQKLLAVVGDDRSSAKDLTQVLSCDQALTGKVLKLVNSSFYGFSGKVSTLSRAVVILGYSAIRNLAISFSAYDTLKNMKGPIDWEKFWFHSLTCAASAHTIAVKMKYPEPEEAFVCGLLHDIGYFIISLALPEEFKMIEGIAGNQEKEKETIGLSHTEVGIRLLEHWKLPENICRCARFHHSAKLLASGSEQLLTIIMLADALSCVKGNHFIDEDDYRVLPQILKAAKLDISSYESILSEIDTRIEEAKAFLNIAESSGKLTAADMQGEEIATIVVVSADEIRRSWVESILKSFGQHVVSTSALSDNSEEHEDIHLAILDPMGLEYEPMGKLASCLKARGVPVAFLDCEKEGQDRIPDEHRGVPKIKLVFSRPDITGLLREVRT